MEILISLAVGIALMEMYAWLGPLPMWIVRRAAKELPDDRVEEFIEQWEADLAAVPNSIMKVCYVLRDCLLPIKDIAQTMFRAQIEEITDGFEPMLAKIVKVEAMPERSLTLVQHSARSGTKMVADLAELSDRLQQFQRDNKAQNEIDHVRALSLPVAEKLSNYHAGLEQYYNNLSALVTSLRGPATKATETYFCIKRRLLDEKPIDDDDVVLVEAFVDAITQMGAAFDTHRQGVEIDYRTPIAEVTTAMNAVRAAFRDAVDAVKETRKPH